ncbi:MAG: hypothetical protein WCS99_08705 [Limisphaerales bacterium]
MDTILTNLTVSVTELKRNFASIIKQADDSPVAILNHNRPAKHREIRKSVSKVGVGETAVAICLRH